MQTTLWLGRSLGSTDSHSAPQLPALISEVAQHWKPKLCDPLEKHKTWMGAEYNYRAYLTDPII